MGRTIGTEGSNLNDSDSSLAVLKLQHALNKLAGIKLVPEDGWYGLETSNAVLNFQREHQIPDTGKIDEQTIDAIHIALQRKPLAPPLVSEENSANSTNTLTQSKAGVIAPPLHMMSDAFAISVRQILEQWSAGDVAMAKIRTSLNTNMNQQAQNPVITSGAAMGKHVLIPALPLLFQYEPMRVPLAQFSSQLEAVMLRNPTLSAPQLIAFAENTALLMRSVLPKIFSAIKVSVLSELKEVFRKIHLMNPSIVPDSGFITLPGAGALLESGEMLAGLLSGAAFRQAPPSQLLQSTAFTGALTTFAVAAAVPFVGSGAGYAAYVHTAAFAGALLIGLISHVPELLLRSGLVGYRIGDLVETLPARWFLLNFAIATITVAVMIVLSKNSVEVEHREAAFNFRQAIKASLSTDAEFFNDAITKHLKQTAAICDQMIAAVAYAAEAIRLKSALHTIGIVPTLDPKISANLQGMVHRILNVVGKINEHSTRLLFIAEGI
ncbi:MAG TPA: peptidoglycan-binding domain-containing protein [Acidobacteriota bacterium]|nr:peptidoglycan-binding domain-containing protein [Acidobacteriota bacterium]